MIFGRNLYGGKKRLHSTSLAVNCVQSSVSIRCCNETFCLIITFCFSGINRSFTSIHSFRQFQLIYILNNLHGSRTIAQPFSYSNSIKRWLMTVIIIWTCMFWRRLTFMLVACMKLFGIRICWNYLTFEFIWLRLVYLIKMCTVLSSASWILQSLHFSNNNSFALSCDKKKLRTDTPDVWVSCAIKTFNFHWSLISILSHWFDFSICHRIQPKNSIKNW